MSRARISINPSARNDDHYRYKMEAARVKHEVKGQYSKTVILNLEKVAKALNRDPMLILSYFGMVLGVKVEKQEGVTQQRGEKAKGDDRWTVNGYFDTEKVQATIDAFILKCVFCINCGNPETSVVVKKKDVKLRCASCSACKEVTADRKLLNAMIKHQDKQDSFATLYGKSARTEAPSDDGDDDDAEYAALKGKFTSKPKAPSDRLNDFFATCKTTDAFPPSTDDTVGEIKQIQDDCLLDDKEALKIACGVFLADVGFSPHYSYVASVLSVFTKKEANLLKYTDKYAKKHLAKKDLVQLVKTFIEEQVVTEEGIRKYLKKNPGSALELI